MSLRSFFTRPAAAGDLRTQLIQLVARKDLSSLAAVVRERRATIVSEFPQWMTVPMSLQDDQPLLARYGEMLMAVARILERDGDASLARMLEGDPANQPVESWNEQIATGSALSAQGRHGDAAQVFAALAERLAGMRGSAVDFYRPRVLGKLGIALYQSGNAERALEVTREARNLCERLGDEEGVSAYEASLANMNQD